ncbi:hypothetical protein KY285_027513 [Solanum tuberosum]|nr:hypothetical protein KY285_027513 [Solanum tuberosum]
MICDDCEISLNGERTLLLVGRTGDGKSATGNSILGTKAFKSMHCSSCVTTACQLQTTQLQDGNILNVIDTPGLFDFSCGPDFVVRELFKCFNLAKDGIHAVLLLLSVRTRFSREEHTSVQCLLNLFESKISDYMIVVFTGGDELEDDETLDDYLGCFPEPLKVESNLRGMRHLEAELAKERVARLEAEKSAEAALMNLENKRRLMRDIYRYRQRPMVADKLQERKLESSAGMCQFCLLDYAIRTSIYP